jgi:hypothetical protein
MMDGQQLRRYVRPSWSTDSMERSRGLENTGVEFKDLRIRRDTNAPDSLVPTPSPLLKAP